MESKVATAHQTVAAILESSKRSSLPLRHSFVQKPGRSAGQGPLAEFVRTHNNRGLDQYLLFHAAASAPPYNVARHSKIWARALGLGQSVSSTAAVSKTWAWLIRNGLVAKGRRGRISSPTLLREDGSRKPYKHPSEKSERYFQIPYEFWLDSKRWYQRLDLPAKAVLLIALSLDDGFVLPAEHAQKWYGVSADTVGRGLRRLVDEGLLKRVRVRKVAPLAPDGFTWESHYTLLPPFGPRGRKKRRSKKGSG